MLRRTLVMLQVALACLLLCAAGVVLLSLQRLLTASPGFQSADVLTMQMMLPPARYPDIRSRGRFVEQVVERVSGVPGVISAGTTQTTFMPNESMQARMFVDGRPVDAEHADSSHIRHVTPGYFRSLLVPIIEGRALDARARLGATPVCMVRHPESARRTPRHRVYFSKWHELRSDTSHQPQREIHVAQGGPGGHEPPRLDDHARIAQRDTRVSLSKERR